MWDNIGAKVQKLAKFICWFGIIASVVGAIVGVISGISMNSRHYGNAGTVTIISSLLGGVLGALFSWIGSWVTYAIGEAAEAAEEAKRHMH